MIFEDEATFRQSTTLHQTWARKNAQPKVPSSSQRKSVKVYGAICPQDCRFDFRLQHEYFNGEDYLCYLEDSLIPTFYKKGQKIILIHDNASYHHSPEVREWKDAYKRYIHIEPLPPYSPELNAAEKIWKYTRKEATHNKYFESEIEPYTLPLAAASFLCF